MHRQTITRHAAVDQHVFDAAAAAVAVAIKKIHAKLENLDTELRLVVKLVDAEHDLAPYTVSKLQACTELTEQTLPTELKDLQQRMSTLTHAVADGQKTAARLTRHAAEMDDEMQRVYDEAYQEAVDDLMAQGLDESEARELAEWSAMEAVEAWQMDDNTDITREDLNEYMGMYN